jgi:hypothetical protein
MEKSACHLVDQVRQMDPLHEVMVHGDQHQWASSCCRLGLVQYHRRQSQAQG